MPLLTMSVLHDIVGALVVASLWLAIARAPLDLDTRRLLQLGFGLAMVGCIAYLWVAGKVFGGGDYILYVRQGVVYATETLTEGLTALAAPERWSPGRWWGAGVVSRIAGVVVLLVGPSVVSVSVVFAMMKHAGVVLFILAFRRALPAVQTAPYAAWMVLAPSMVYWPSIAGKEAVMVLGLGLATWGLAKPTRFRHGLAICLGVGLTLSIRPSVAIVWAAAVIVMQGVDLARRRTRQSIARAVVLGLGTCAVVALASGAVASADLPWTGRDFSFFRLSDILLFLEQKASASSQGGSALRDWRAGTSPLGALVSTWLRPLPWTVRSVPQAVAAAEVLAFWILLGVRRRAIVSFLRANGREPLVVFSLAFVAVYALALGLALSNEGALVRQRTLMLPFLFISMSGARPEVTE